jgi:uncharacterized protein YcnI
LTRISRALQRALILVTLAAAALTVGLLGLLVGIPTASAHVHVDAGEAVPGEETMVGFQVSNESENGSLTTQLTVTMPTGTAAAGEFVPQTDKVSFPAAQSYSDVSVVNWNQGPLPCGGEPNHPVPTLTLAKAAAALVVGAVAVTLTLVRRRS